MRMKNVHREAVDRNDPLLPPFYGVFERRFMTGCRERRLLLYIPETARPSAAGILLIGPDGAKAEEILGLETGTDSRENEESRNRDESGWIRLAEGILEREKIILAVAEAPEEGWNTEEEYGTMDEDIAYVNEAAILARDRKYCCIHESKLYLVGLGEGGTIAHMAAAWNPAFYAGVASIGEADVAETYLKACGDDYCTELDGYQDPLHSHGILKKDIPMPALIVTNPRTETGSADRILSYWARSCKAAKTEEGNEGTELYIRTDPTPYPDNQDRDAYRVCRTHLDSPVSGFAGHLAEEVYCGFLGKQRRWMSSPEGDLRVTKDPVRDLRMDYYYEMIDGWRREWYVYVPESVRSAPEIKVPLVLAMHGYSCSGEIYIGNSGWHRVAEKYGFIAAFPTALPAHVNMPENGLKPEDALLPAWNVFEENDRPDELSFFRQMLARIKEKYPVDQGRVFATGHSWGSMMTQLLGLGMTEEFAAIAPCSGVFFGGASKIITKLPEVQKRNGRKLPVWMFWGTEEEWLIPASPARDNETGFTVEYWMHKNGHDEDAILDYQEGRYRKNGRFRDYFYDKSGVPVRFTIVEYMPHATMPEMSFRIWEEFFSL